MPMATPAEQRAYQNAWMKARREKWLAANGPCRRCGSDEEMQVDHIDPRTKVTHLVWSWAEDRRLAELAKCQVLCRPCHEAKTLIEIGGECAHGTRNRYRRYRCRCDLCRAANRLEARRTRAEGVAAGLPVYVLPAVSGRPKAALLDQLSFFEVAS